MPDGQVEGSVLKLKAGHFDPVKDPAPGPTWLKARSTHPYYLVQFDGIVRTEWVGDVGKLDVKLLQYLPDNAFFATVPKASLDDLRSLDSIRYVGPIHPAFRVSPDLWKDLASDSYAELDILVWYEDRAERVAKQVLDDGGQVLRLDWDIVSVRVRLLTAALMLADPSFSIRWIEPTPQIEIINDNDARTAKARQTSDGSYVSDGHALWSYNPTDDAFEGFTGKNVTITVADTGLDTGHPTFEGRIVEYYDYGGNGEFDANGHGTHVAGTALGDGSWRTTDIGQDGKYAGLAPEAGLVVQEVFVAGNPGANGMGRDAESQGADISSNSWVSGAFGDYNGQCEAYDRLSLDANNVKPGDQPIFYVFGAGNDGRGGPGTIRPPSLAKNVLSVGSTGNDKWGASSNLVSDFSARGPVEDGRIKPDVLLPGYIVSSSKSSYPGANSGYPRPPDGQSSYVYGTGTSMATPGVSGATAVVIQYMVEELGHTPSSALLKAILINGATPLDGYEYPGNDQGWGRVDLENSLLETSDYRIWREDQEVDLDTDADTNVSSYWFMVDPSNPLKVTLAWSDVPGMVNSDKHLVNDLDLELVDPDGKLYSGNAFKDGKSEVNTTFKPDRVNNVEGVLLDAPKAGLWNLRVRAHNVPQGSQDFALVVSGNIVPGHVDLTVDGLVASPLNAEEGDTITLSATVRNLGNRDTAGVNVRLSHVDPNLISEVVFDGTLNQLTAGISQALEWKVTGTRGDHVYRLEVDPIGSIIESDERNNKIEIDYFYKGYDVGLTSTTEKLKGDPGQLINFMLTVANGGNVPDELLMDLTDPPPGWQAQLTAGSHSIDAMDSKEVRLEILIPSNATAGEWANLSVSVRSTGNSTKTARIDLSVEVNQVFGLEVAALTGRQDMLPGEDRELQLMLRNTGNGLDVYTIALPEQLPGDWWVQIPEGSIEVPLRSEVTVKVILTAPDLALAGISVDFAVSITSSSPVLSKSVDFSAKVIQFYDTEVSVIDPVLAGDVGERIIMPLNIANKGNGPVSYNGDINFPDDSWTGGLDIEDLSLEGYSDAPVNLSFLVPERAINRSYEFTMVVISSGGEIHFYNFTFSVRQFFITAITVTSTPPTVTQGEPAWVQLLVENQGNGLDTVMLTADIPSTWTFEFDDKLPLVEAFSSTSVNLRLDTERMTPSGLYDVSITGYFGLAKTEEVSTNASIEVLSRPDLVLSADDINISDENPMTDTLVRITATVVNDGETVAEDVFVQLFVDGIPIGQPEYMSSIESGEAESFVMMWRTNRSGLRELKVVADYNDDIDEPDEGNNQADLTIRVKPLELQASPGLSIYTVVLAFVAATTFMVRRRTRSMTIFRPPPR
jgi:uncharacterized membrane protein/subtilisin family serine protease